MTSADNIFMHGLGKALPKGEHLLVPFICDIFVADPIYGQTTKQEFMRRLKEKFDMLAAENKKNHPDIN